MATKDLKVRIEGPSQVSLFCYDNGTFIVESFLPEPVRVKIVFSNPYKAITDLISNETLEGNLVSNAFFRNRQATPEYNVELIIKPHSYMVYQLQ